MKIYDVIIIGAGMAGLSAGSQLKKSNKNILILEGRDRIGGRLSTEKLDDSLIFERGGELIHGTNNPIYELVNNLDIAIHEVQHTKTDKSFGIVDTIKSSILYVCLLLGIYPKPSVDENLQDYLKRINKYLPKSIQEFIDKESVDLETYDKVSAVHIVDRVRRQISEGELYGDHDFLIKDGYIQILEYLAQSLSVLFNHTVTSVNWTNEIVTVKTNNGDFFAKKVILTLPIPILSSLPFEPPLPKQKRVAIEGHVSGDIIKLIIPVPVDAIKTAEEVGIIKNVNLVPSWWRRNFEGDEQIFVGWITGPFARRFVEIEENESIEIALKEMSSLFDSSSVDRKKIIVQNWSEDTFSQGTYCYIKPGYSLSIIDDLKKPLQNKLFFAGTATAKESGTAHGAYASGLRVADEVLS